MPNRQFGRLIALENTRRVESHQVRAVLQTGAEAHQTTLVRGGAKSMNCRNPIVDGPVSENSGSAIEREASAKDQHGVVVGRKRCELGLEPTVTAPRDDRQSKTTCIRCGPR